MGCDLRRCNKFIFLPFSVCSADLDLLCSGSFTHHFKFSKIYFSAQGFHPGGLCIWCTSRVQQCSPKSISPKILLVLLYYYMGNFCNLIGFRGVARIFQRGGHRGYSQDQHPGIADYIWFIPLLSLVYQRAQSYYRGMKALINKRL